MARSAFINFLGRFSDIPQYVNTISDLTIDFGAIAKTRSIGVPKGEIDDELGDDIVLGKEHVPYMNKNYGKKLSTIKSFAANIEIDDILEKMTNEAINYDDNLEFCTVEVGTLKYREEIKKKIEDSIKSSFKSAMAAMGYQKAGKAWDDFYEWLIEGTKVFEYTVDDLNEPKKITGIVELDSDSVVPVIKREVISGDKRDIDSVRYKETKMWYQITSNTMGNTNKRIIPDNLLCVVSYNNLPGCNNKISYAEGLMRPFNLMRILEDTKMGWYIMNSQTRMKMLIPVGNQTKDKVKMTLSRVASKTKEDLFIDSSTGEPSISGSPKINFSKYIILPKRPNDSPVIESIAYEGPDLTEMASVKHFEKKLMRYSKLPFARYDTEQGGGLRNLFKGDGVPYDELSFNSVVNRFRREFEKPIRKYILIQLMMDIPELKADNDIESCIKIKYQSNSYFEEAKRHEVLSIKLEQIDKMAEMKDSQGNPIYSKKWLYIKSPWAVMTEEQYTENATMMNEEMNTQ